MFLHLTMSALEFPYIKTLLHDQITVIHNVESQEVVQTVPAPPLPSLSEISLMTLLGSERRGLECEWVLCTDVAAIREIDFKESETSELETRSPETESGPNAADRGRGAQEPSYAAEDAAESEVPAAESPARSASTISCDV